MSNPAKKTVILIPVLHEGVQKNQSDSDRLLNIHKSKLEPISKMQIGFEGKASVDEKAQHTCSM